MSETNGYTHLGPRLGSSYRQYFVNGTGVRAETLYSQTVNSEPRTPEEVARDYDLPVQVVQEAIRYCLENPDVLQRDWEEEEEIYRSREWPKPAPEAGTPVS